jgi:hypothetical protein
MTWDIPAMVTAATGILDKIIPDRDARERAANAIVMEQLRQQESQLSAQSDTNKIEAANSSIFVSGWRPFLGWSCGAGFAWQVLGQPVFSFFFVLFTSNPAPVIALPEDMIMPTLWALLGVGAMRSFDKLKGTSK